MPGRLSSPIGPIRVLGMVLNVSMIDYHTHVTRSAASSGTDVTKRQSADSRLCERRVRRTRADLGWERLKLGRRERTRVAPRATRALS